VYSFALFRIYMYLLFHLVIAPYYLKLFRCAIRFFSSTVIPTNKRIHYSSRAVLLISLKASRLFWWPMSLGLHFRRSTFDWHC